MSNPCVNCEVHPVVEINGEKLCSIHAEQRADMSARTAPPIAYTRPVAFRSLHQGHGTSGTPRHYK